MDKLRSSIKAQSAVRFTASVLEVLGRSSDSHDVSDKELEHVTYNTSICMTSGSILALSVGVDGAAT